ncbi:hypothetical protein H9657_17155 [Cellulomonas sp. Sa3CUA2]|uniref:DUF6318 domain-containing protein n=1 Tax=Cellulomonas avistercoris TaxID=2762242 RepID=A0ABR8QHT3_9CELL|nr:DUF6318 family protein [Cellulomonas avistercoris]MBD7920002.1 hypothetical protein [Cellulomonas avistercoris]
MRRRGCAVLRGAATVLAVALLGACTGAGEPVESPTAAPSPSVTATASPAPTPMAFPTPAPEYAEPTPEGAIAAATHFIALYDYAFSTGDAGPLAAMSADGCEYCVHVRDQVQAMVDGGFSSIRDPARIQASDSTEIREDEWFRVFLRVEQGPLVTVMPDGARHQTSDGGRVDFIFAISWVDGGWRIEGADLQEVET